MAQIDLVDELLGKYALDNPPALLADQEEWNRLPFRLKLCGPLAGSADDVGVERAGEASLRRGDDQQMDLILARPCEQLRAFRPDLHLCAEARHHGRKALGVRTAGLSRLLRAAQLGGGHHRSEEHTSELQSLMRISYA